MKKIPLTRGKYAIVDDADYDRINEHKWCYDGSYAQRKRNGENIRMHRVLVGAKKGEIVDHINRNKLDNRRSNLRVVSRTVNLLNSKTPKHNTSGHKGVSWDKQTDKWRAQIQINNKGISLGRFGDIEDAIEERKSAERRFAHA